MSRVIKAAIFNSHSSYVFQRAAFFHSTPVLEHKRCNNWQFGKRQRRMRAKQELLRKFGAYADVMFGSWKDEFHEDDPLSSTGPSWSKKQHSKGSKREQPRNKRFYYRGRRPFEFCQDIDDEVENIFGSAFGGSRFFYWSFLNEDPQWRRSRYLNNYERSWSWSYRFDEDSDSSTESGNAESSDQDTIADRRALGLSASGPLTLEVVKTHIDPVH